MVVAISTPLTAAAQTTIEVFTRPGCGHCAAARRFLADEARTRPDVIVVTHDVSSDRQALQRLHRLSARAGITTPGVPTFVINGRVVVGFDPDSTPAELRALLGRPRGDGAASGARCEPDDTACKPKQKHSIKVPLIGKVSVDRVGLPVFTVVLGLVDGFNPCATWVLLFLLAMLVNLQDRSRMALIAGTFVVVSGVVYFAFMAAWLTFFTVVGVAGPIRLVLAALALLFGALNVKDFFAFGRGPSLSIPESAKPGLYARVRSILRAENLTGAMTGVIVLAFLVNLVELLCTAGLPALYTAVLTSRDLPVWQHYGYLMLYVIAYMIDDAILVAIGVITLSKRKLQERAGRWLKLLSGVVMLILGMLFLVRPNWLGF